MIGWIDVGNNLLTINQLGKNQLYKDGRFEPLTNSSKSLTWAYKVKALKSSL